MTSFFQTKYIALYSLFLILKYVNMLVDRNTDLIRHFNKLNACISGWSLNITGINQQKCESKNCIFAEAHLGLLPDISYFVLDWIYGISCA